jgi:hypothetical protein
MEWNHLVLVDDFILLTFPPKIGLSHFLPPADSHRHHFIWPSKWPSSTCSDSFIHSLLQFLFNIINSSFLTNSNPQHSTQSLPFLQFHPSTQMAHSPLAFFQVHPLPVPPRHRSMSVISSSNSSSASSCPFSTAFQKPIPPPLPPKKHSLMTAQFAMAAAKRNITENGKEQIQKVKMKGTEQ